jgi:glycerol-1-phosphate dehydrogenase [NAD(P)+]
MKNHNGVIDELINGIWISPSDQNKYSIPIKNIQILESVEGLESSLVNTLHDNQKLLVVSDPFTHKAMGKRIFQNLKGKVNADEYIWEKPSSSIQGVDHLREKLQNYDGMIAVGSGTVSDSIKYATFLEKKNYSVFATTPMNAYTTGTASISFDGVKKSLVAHYAQGVFFDLNVLSQCPKRLTAAAFADVICRTTAQVDWLMSHQLLNTEYKPIPYDLLALYEQQMIDAAKEISEGKIDALALLTRISAIMGLGTSFTQTTHVGSMGEHGISHYIDMFAGDKHPGTSHGEQVGIATISISKLQNAILKKNQPPIISPTTIPEDEIIQKIGAPMLETIKKAMEPKMFDQKKAEEINQYFSKHWLEFVEPLRQKMLDFEVIWNSMGECGALRTAEDAKLDSNFYKDALKYGRFIRDRYTILDLAGDSNQLDNLINV